MTRICLILGLLFSFLLPSRFAWAYPEFIGYKYSSCLTCHFNGNGGGPLNDYGRALWSAEIAGHAFSGSQTAEQLGESSGFLGSTKLPEWLRPGIKGRYMELITEPGTAKKQTMGILMQDDASVGIAFDADQKYFLMLTGGYTPEKYRRQSNGDKVGAFNSREYYFRLQASEALWLYAGFLDKPYGIRNVDHTAFSRGTIGLGQDDQAHGLIAQYIKPDWEASVDVFAGNLSQDSTLRQKGASGVFEYEIKPAWRLGLSALTSSGTSVKEQRLGLHTRYGLGFGSSVMFEVGNIKNAPSVGTSTSGYYLYSEVFQKVARGYHFFLNGQAYKDNMVAGRPDNLRFGLGLLAFPLARVEWRLEAQNSRQIYGGSEAPPSSWAVLLQLHLSL